MASRAAKRERRLAMLKESSTTRPGGRAKRSSQTGSFTALSSDGSFKGSTTEMDGEENNPSLSNIIPTGETVSQKVRMSRTMIGSGRASFPFPSEARFSERAHQFPRAHTITRLVQVSTSLGDLFDAAMADPANLASPEEKDAEKAEEPETISARITAASQTLAPIIPPPFGSPVAPKEAPAGDLEAQKRYPRPSMMLIEGLPEEASSTDPEPVYSTIDRSRPAGSASSKMSNGYAGGVEVIYDNVIPSGANVISFMSPAKAFAPSLPPRNTPTAAPRPKSLAVPDLLVNDGPAPSKPPRKSRPVSEDFDLRLNSPKLEMPATPYETTLVA